jgi:hypothetical protein
MVKKKKKDKVMWQDREMGEEKKIMSHRRHTGTLF